MKRRASKSPSSAALEKGGARIEEHRLENGLQVLLAARRSDPVVAVMTFFKVGARNEREHETGVSHFLEHMMFKGSARFGKGEVDRITTELGGSNNAFTSYDHTAYWFELASDRWERALEIEADRMQTLALEPAEFDAERAVVLEELSMGLDEPWRNLSELVATAVFPRHPYRRPIIGHADALRRLRSEEMRDYYKRFYHPGNATLVICGDVEPADALERVRRHFGAIPVGMPYAQADCFRPAAEAQPGEQRLRMAWDDQGRRLCMAWPTVAVGTPDDYALDVIGTLLAGSRMSRLHRKLVLERGLATSISTHSDTRVESGIFWLFAECAQGVEPERLERAVDEELERLRGEPVGRQELERVRAMLAASEAYESETVSDLAEHLGELAADADWRLAVHGLAKILAVDARAVQDCAKRLLAPERRVVGWSLPQAPQTRPPARPRAQAKQRERRRRSKSDVRKVPVKKVRRGR